MLAPTRVAAPPAVVAWAAAARTACHRRRDACAHPADEPGECPVGRTAHPGRTGEARDTNPRTTIAKYMARRLGPPSPTWRTFLRHHADDGVAKGAYAELARRLHTLSVQAIQALPLVAGLLDDDRSAAVCTAGHRIPHTAERYHVCAEHPGSRSCGPCACPRRVHPSPSGQATMTPYVSTCPEPSRQPICVWPHRPWGD